VADEKWPNTSARKLEGPHHAGIPYFTNEQRAPIGPITGEKRRQENPALMRDSTYFELQNEGASAKFSWVSLVLFRT